MSKFNVGDRVYFTPVENTVTGKRVRATVVRIGDEPGYDFYDYLVEVDDCDTPPMLKMLMQMRGTNAEAAHERELTPIPDEELEEIAALEELYDKS